MTDARNEHCPHPARKGLHEEYARPDGSLFCRACGAELRATSLRGTAPAAPPTDDLDDELLGARLVPRVQSQVRQAKASLALDEALRPGRHDAMNAAFGGPNPPRTADEVRDAFGPGAAAAWRKVAEASREYWAAVDLYD